MSIILAVIFGLFFAWFIVPDPPEWVVAIKTWIWEKVSELTKKKE